MAADDGDREERIRNANSELRGNLTVEGESMGARRRSHVNFDELNNNGNNSPPNNNGDSNTTHAQDGGASAKKGTEVKPVKSD